MDKTSSRFAREEKTIAAMLGIYCKDTHASGDALCADCGALREYAMKKLERCPFGEDKPSCNACTVHCYQPAQREQIRTVMRYAGPRMLKHHPLLALRHLAGKLTDKKKAGVRKARSRKPD